MHTCDLKNKDWFEWIKNITQTICSQFEEMLPHLNGSSTGEGHLEISLTLPATWENK